MILETVIGTLKVLGAIALPAIKYTLGCMELNEVVGVINQVVDNPCFENIKNCTDILSLGCVKSTMLGFIDIVKAYNNADEFTHGVDDTINTLLEVVKVAVDTFVTL